MGRRRQPPRLFDASHRLLFGPARNDQERHYVFALAATQILYHNRPGQPFAGVYVDDSTPNRDTYAEGLVEALAAPPPAAGHLPDPMVLVSLATEEDPHHTIPGCVMAWEYYPYPRGDPPTVLATGLQAYIVQWNFAFPGCKPPSLAQRWQLLKDVKALHPKLVLLY